MFILELLSSPFGYSLILGFIIFLDFLYRILASIKIELPTVEIIIFSCVHCVYQLFGIFILNHQSLWGTQTIAWIKLVILLHLLIFAIIQYSKIQKYLNLSINTKLDELLGINPIELSDEQKSQLGTIKNIALHYISADLWIKSKEKKKERTHMMELLKEIGIPDDEINETYFMIDTDDRKIFKRNTLILTIISVLVAVWPI